MYPPQKKGVKLDYWRNNETHKSAWIFFFVNGVIGSDESFDRCKWRLLVLTIANGQQIMKKVRSRRNESDPDSNVL